MFCFNLLKLGKLVCNIIDCFVCHFGNAHEYINSVWTTLAVALVIAWERTQVSPWPVITRAITRALIHSYITLF